MAILVVLATITAGAAVWIRTSAFDSKAVAADAKVFLRDPSLNSEVAKFLTDTAVDLGDQVKESSRDRNLGRVVSKALTREKISPLAEKIAASDQVIDSLAALVEQAHRQMLDIAKGNSPEPVNVSLNLVPVVVSVLDEMQVDKIIPASVALPELADGATPEEDVAAFGRAFKMKMKKDFGQLMIVNSAPKSESNPDQSAGQGQDGSEKDSGDKGMAYSDLDGKLSGASTGTAGVLLVWAALIAAVVFLAPTRRTGLRIAAGALFVASVVSAVVIRVAPTRLQEQIDDETQANVIRAILDAVLSSYVTLTTIMLVASVLLVAGTVWGPALVARSGQRNDS